MILRPATALDSDYFFTLRCDPVAARMSRRRPPTTVEHDKWWSETKDLRFVAVDIDEEGTLIGTLRLAADGVVSIIVDPRFRGQGYGPRMLAAVEPFAKDAGIHTMLAEIAYENVASQRCFLNAGWVPVLLERHV
jgi:RimJ/RimL family protein N-acetyltransferase